MKRNFIHPAVGAGLALLLAAGCSRTIAEGPASGAIGFAAPVTRAAVERFAAGDAFSVWGWYTPADAGSEVFNATKVSTADGSSWSYDNPRFWKAGRSYTFQALSPSVEQLAAATASCTSDGVLTVQDFDASQQVDLMAAASPTMAGSAPAPVSFTFSHLLARVQLVGRLSESSAGVAGFDPRVYSVRLYGIPALGSLTLDTSLLGDAEALRSAWSPSGTTSATAPAALFTSDAGAAISADGTLLLDALPLPQQLSQTAVVEIEYATNGSGERQTATVQLTSLPVTLWEAGRQYRYTFTIADNDRILFDIPTVNPWSEAVGGIVIVD